jgi:phosphohistidine phosphatase
MGRALAARMPPVAIALSPALRARLTFAGLCEGWPALSGLNHRTDENLYTFSGDALMQWLCRQDDGLTSLFIIGHNPALTMITNALVGKHILDNLPTAAFAQLSLDIDCWGAINPGCGQLVEVLLPRTLEKN